MSPVGARGLGVQPHTQHSPLMEWGSLQSIAVSQVGTLRPQGGWAPHGSLSPPLRPPAGAPGHLFQVSSLLGHRRGPRTMGEEAGLSGPLPQIPSLPSPPVVSKDTLGSPVSHRPPDLPVPCQTMSRPKVKVSMESPGHSALPPAHQCLGAWPLCSFSLPSGGGVPLVISLEFCVTISTPSVVSVWAQEPGEEAAPGCLTRSHPTPTQMGPQACMCFWEHTGFSVVGAHAPAGPGPRHPWFMHITEIR